MTILYIPGARQQQELFWFVASLWANVRFEEADWEAWDKLGRTR